jgi:hypothetical protein
VEYGLSDGQVRFITRMRDKLLVLASDAELTGADATLADYLKECAPFLSGAKDRLGGKPDLYRKAAPKDV